ncbi:hypothetical protein OCH239_08265 [Roseivivax halodurans JCM 10272]|uniref:UDP-N-acetylmuramate--alanine ligase n=1 Tax=Roseivivax halodurans JCM 10272 TaxID=1449350 RepID=X7EJ47_9RHOB|nr:DUF2484 family protein [Roseivivax halodurans]ETX16144.1 hypothetical protein OCH239_08265 [Roseivivax halodurans JCM 10272]
MTLSLALAVFWVIAANLAATAPTSDTAWSRADLLIAIGIPLVGYLTLQNGPWVGLLALAAGMSVLRWPMRRLVRWPRPQAGTEA